MQNYLLEKTLTKLFKSYRRNIGNGTPIAITSCVFRNTYTVHLFDFKNYLKMQKKYNVGFHIFKTKFAATNSE